MKYLQILLYPAILFALTACERYLSIAPPNDKLETSAVFTDSTAASLALSGIYSALENANFFPVQGPWAALTADELGYTATRDELLQLANTNIQVNNANVNSLWSAIYAHLYQLNSAWEGIQSAKAISGPAKNTLLAEIQFLRAYVLFYAVNNWGDVPLTLSTDYRMNEKMPRTPQAEVYLQILADLTFAKENLPVPGPADERIRANKWAATALLARVQLYRQDWDKAAQSASDVIASGEYLPLAPTAETFLKESRETILQLLPASISSSIWAPDGNLYVPASLTNNTIPLYVIPESLYASFEAQDQRKENWIGVKTVEGVPYYFPYKYKVGTAPAGVASTEYPVVLRLAEQYLIRAEARAQLNDLTGAITDLNVIRTRAGLDDLPPDLTQDEVLTAVETERRHEFFCEWGHRWFDLKRTGKTDKLWPIPLNQLLTNPNLTQNEGY